MKILKREKTITLKGYTRHYFTILNDKGVKYSIWILVDGKNVLDFSCTCANGSFYKWSKKNQKINKPCKHIRLCLEELQ